MTTTTLTEEQEDEILGLSEQRDLSAQIFQEAEQVERNEPELSLLLRRTILAPGVLSFEDAVASTVCYRLLLHPCCEQPPPNSQKKEPITPFCPNSLRALIRTCLDSSWLEYGHTMAHAVRQDTLAVIRRDPAVDSLLEVVLYSKGFAALVCHRAAHRLWKEQGRKFTALFLQSQASAVFGLDLHPLTVIGCGVMLDHGTGVVMGETAVVGNDCTILHSVTLGGTGKEHGDRHPKVGNNVLIGASASLLGNIVVGDSVKIGAGSVVLRTIPPHATAVGVPAKIIGRASESRPGSDMDELLEQVSLLHESVTNVSLSTEDLEEEDITEHDLNDSNICPYREYTRLAKQAPPGTITICALRDLLQPYGCSQAQIGACFFTLDTHSVGFVRKQVFERTAAAVIKEYTSLTEDVVEQIVQNADTVLRSANNGCEHDF